MSNTKLRTWTRCLVVCGLSAASVCSFASLAVAVALPAGSTIFAPAEPNPVGGVVVAGGAPVPFAAGAYSGTLTSTVLAGDVSNPFGGLTFTYLLTNDVTSTDELGRLTVNDYAGFLVDGSYLPGLGVAPILLDRNAVGDVIGYSFVAFPVGLGTIIPGAASTLLVLQTNALAFEETFASVIDGSVTMVPSLGPAIVPEPSTLLLASLGVACLALVRARRRSKN